MSQAHGTALWREPAGNGAAPSVVPVYFISDGAGGVTWSLSGPERYVFIDVGSNGGYTLIDKGTSVYLVSDGAGGYTISTTGPAVAIFADDGAGGVVLTSDLTRAPIADLYYDTGGNLWLVRRTCNRLRAVQLAGANVQLYQG